MPNYASGEVVLPKGHTGSSLFHAVLTEAATQYESALGSAKFPSSASVFKRGYGASLARFEAARVRAPERVEIARFIVRRTLDALCYGNRDVALPLTSFLSERVATPPLERRALGERGGLTLEVPLDGKLYRGAAIRDLVRRLYEQHQLTLAARAALDWIVDHALAQGGSLDLRGQRFVLLGAGAELSSARLLLEAGASVLWVDLAEPTRSLANADALAGAITRAPLASNLLTQPREVAASIRAFAEDGPVHVGMFAYAPGASKEWRLGAAMNALVASLEPGLVSSVSLLISPTTPSVLSLETALGRDSRYAIAPAWQKWLERTGVIAHPGDLRVADTRISLSTVSLQGLSYQAAQYISKIAAAETYAVFGTDLTSEHKRPVTVSANVAGITRTRSLSHPLFNAAFEGASRFGVRIFDPETTRALNGYLMLHDLLNPAAAGAASVQPTDERAKAAGVLEKQIHGGIYTLPFVLEGVIRAAAVVGLVSRPSLLLQKSRPDSQATEALPLAAE